jgi:hypothetical protein
MLRLRSQPQASTSRYVVTVIHCASATSPLLRLLLPQPCYVCILIRLGGQPQAAAGPGQLPGKYNSCICKLTLAAAITAATLFDLSACSDWEASRRLLPPLASSLAYSNYSSWQAQHEGQALPQVAPGVSIPDLYKAAEREVRGGLHA